MSRSTTRWSAILATAVAIGCGGEEAETTQSAKGDVHVAEVQTQPQQAEDRVAQVQAQLQQAKGQVAGAQQRAAAQTETGTDPCAVLTDAIVRRELSVETGAPIETKRGQAARHVCTHTWQDPSFDHEAYNRRVIEQMMKAMRKGGAAQGMIELAARARSGFEVSYTHGPTAESPEAARRFFEQAMARMEKGISRQIDRGPAKGREVTFQMTTEPEGDVGDLARRTARMSQLGVVNWNQIFYVTAQVSDAAPENLAAARKLALSIIRS